MVLDLDRDHEKCGEVVPGGARGGRWDQDRVAGPEGEDVAAGLEGELALERKLDLLDRAVAVTACGFAAGRHVSGVRLEHVEVHGARRRRARGVAAA
jgi:hypothetical protein